MSHAVVMIALQGIDPGDRSAVDEAVAHQMAPFDENGEWFGDGSRWDWYLIGGRWTGYFAIKPEVDLARVVVGEPGLMTAPAEQGRADVAKKCDIDFAGMMDEAGARAGALWTRVDAVTRAHKQDFRTWPEVREAYGGDLDGAREAYRSQPAIMALRAAKDEDLRHIWSPDEIIATEHDAYVDKRRADAFVPHAFLKDRVWNEGERMGWFGATMPNECQIGGEEPNICLYEHPDGSKLVSWRDGWAERFSARFLDKLPDDDVLVAVDYHV